METEIIKKLLQDVKTGSLDINDALQTLKHLPFEDAGFAKIDHHRNLRCGFCEVIYCPGKTNDQITHIFERLATKSNNIIASRANPQIYQALQNTRKFPGIRYESAARTIVYEKKPLEKVGLVAIVCAGTSDIPVAEEAKVTCQTMGNNVETIYDVGVAGLHRILPYIKTLQKANTLIVVAGMEGALPSVVGGMVSAPVIAVPTSVGYGASFKGLSALLTMLNCCASGVTVVNIDNGFGAAYTASLINQKICEAKNENSK